MSESRQFDAVNCGQISPCLARIVFIVRGVVMQVLLEALCPHFLHNHPVIGKLAVAYVRCEDLGYRYSSRAPERIQMLFGREVMCWGASCRYSIYECRLSLHVDLVDEMIESIGRVAKNFHA